MADLFRKSALERLSSPEQLDKAITVSAPVSWLALIGVTVVIVAVLIWAIFGALPTTLEAQGIIVRSEDETEDLTAQCYVQYANAEQIKPGMKATVKSAAGDTRYDALVTDVIFDDSDVSDIELALGSDSIVVIVNLRLTEGQLPERTLVTAKIITQETAPISKLFTS